MNTINLATTSYKLKQHFNVNFFFGERFFVPSANVKVGELVPVYLLNETKENYYLHSMRWGINVFDGCATIAMARFENIMKYEKWRELVAAKQTCLMVLKGYYHHDHRSIFDAKNNRMQKKDDMYYVHSNEEYIYVAGLFQKKQTHKGIQYSVIALTSDSTNTQICNRMPLILNQENVYRWLIKGKVDVKTDKQLCLQFKEIGFWIQDKNEKDESIILQSKEQWIMDQEAEDIGFEDADFPWAIIEQAALEKIKMKEEEYESYELIDDNGKVKLKDDTVEPECKIDEDHVKDKIVKSNNVPVSSDSNEAENEHED